MNATDTQARAGDRIMQAARDFGARPKPTGLMPAARQYVLRDTAANTLATLLGTLASMADRGPVTGGQLAEAVEGILRQGAEQELVQTARYAEHPEFALPEGGVR